ncbi:hypothetical protein LDO31_00370 [Luteimonas sp. XNQY3]|nr:hypothetical protein [Luteimonas sp. XNQY3]MCD9004704.1 hypothetical protein [Luteimonas sp. XNQY3]
MRQLRAGEAVRRFVRDRVAVQRRRIDAGQRGLADSEQQHAERTDHADGDAERDRGLQRDEGQAAAEQPQQKTEVIRRPVIPAKAGMRFNSERRHPAP